jgi:hypothetical protein
METDEKNQQVALHRSRNLGETQGNTEEVEDHGRGRKAILILFFLTIGLSLLFWFQANYSHFFEYFFGKSSWTFTR